MFHVVQSKKVYESNWITLYEELINVDDSHDINPILYNKIETFNTAHVVPILEDGRVLMVENYRHGVGEILLELPGGFIEPGEIPSEAAKRELLEETGYISNKIEMISTFYTWPGRCTQKNHIFRATDLENGQAHKVDQAETIKVLSLSKSEVLNEMHGGRIKSASTISAIFRCYLYFSNK